MASKAVPLSPRCIELLPKAIDFSNEYASTNCELPTAATLGAAISCGQHSAETLKRHIVDNKLVTVPEKEKPVLSEHNEGLLTRAIEFITGFIEVNNRFPGRDAIGKELGCGAENAQRLRKHIIEAKLVAVPPEMDLKEVFNIEKDRWDITLPRTRIHTLQQLLEFFEVDLETWEAERFIANKWEVGAKNAKDELVVEPLYQVKAFLRRKKAAATLEYYATEAARMRRRLEKLKLDFAAERDLCKRLAQNHAGYDDFLANIKEFSQILGDFSLPTDKLALHKPLITPAVADGHTEDAVLLLSDTHYGDQIRRADTSGFPEYDLVIGGNRTGYVAKQAKQILTLHRAMYPIKKLYIWIGGDIGNGDLHDAPQSNQLFLPAQVHFSYHMVKFAIEDLLTLTVPDENGNKVIEEIVLLFTVGNHMRMDEKMPTKLQAQRTLDWLIYQFLIEKFTGVAGVSIKQEMSPYIFENIRGHKHLFAHGMQVGYRNSPDAQCRSMGEFIDRVRSLFDSPEWRRKNNVQGETFARACIGDIHVPVKFPRLVSNASLNGQNELGVNWMLEPIPAGQQLFGVTEKHMETFGYLVECSHIQKEPDHMNVYGDFAEEYASKFAR